METIMPYIRCKPLYSQVPRFGGLGAVPATLRIVVKASCENDVGLGFHRPCCEKTHRHVSRRSQVTPSEKSTKNSLYYAPSGRVPPFERAPRIASLRGEVRAVSHFGKIRIGVSRLLYLFGGHRSSFSSACYSCTCPV